MYLLYRKEKESGQVMLPLRENYYGYLNEFQQQLKEQSLDTEKKLQQQFLQFKELLGKSQSDTVQPPMISSENVPASVSCFLTEEVFRSRVVIEVELHRNVFGQTVDVPIQMALEDIEFVCTSQRLTNNAIVLFIRYLYEKLDGDARQNKFGFMNPAAVHYSVNKTEFVKNVLNRLKDSVGSRKYIFIPCNTGIHWVLIVFFDGVFYYLNSLDEKCRCKLEDVSKALRKLGVKRSEEKLFCVDVKEIGNVDFFVMLYMKHIIESHDTSLRNPKEMFKAGMNYGTSEINEIKRDWTDYISPILEKY
ncbi:hypothetical protein MKW92_000679 [Papaver armeniacum]|nr:hypothetical protein MKW92_000679 [Papaver armeniacum]